MTIERLRALTEWLLPGVLMAFIGLYLVALLAGVEPELALGRAAGVAVGLAVLGRAVQAVLNSPRLDDVSPPKAGIDITIDDESTDEIDIPSAAGVPDEVERFDFPPAATHTTVPSGGN